MGSRYDRRAILIAESDSSFDGWTTALGAYADAVDTVVQRPDETPTSFALRVRALVRGFAERGDLAAAAVIGGRDWDSDILTARSTILRAVVSQMLHAGDGRVFLDGSGAVGRGRFAMQALATVFEDQLGDQGVELITTQGPAAAAKAA